MKSIHKLIVLFFIAALAAMPVAGLAKGGGAGHSGGFGRSNNSGTKNNGTNNNKNNKNTQSQSKPAAAPKVDINNAPADQLATLPGITSDLADKIVAGRPYKSASDLKSKKILTDEQYTAIKNQVTVGKPAAQPSTSKKPPASKPAPAAPSDDSSSE